MLVLNRKPTSNIDMSAVILIRKQTEQYIHEFISKYSFLLRPVAWIFLREYFPYESLQSDVFRFVGSQKISDNTGVLNDN
jgi:hypothetical protein